MNATVSESSFISFIRFPLCIAVIFVHSDFPETIIRDSVSSTQSEYLLRFFYLFSQIIPAIAVPGFFFISGWLFFREQEDFTILSYISKIKTRLRTLVVPYLFWNLILVLLIFLMQSFMPGLSAENARLVSNFSFADWGHVFWDYSSGIYPANFPLWYMRDLFIMMLLSLLIYPLIKRMGSVILIAFAILWLIDATGHIIGLSPSAYFFFYLGAFFKIKRHNFLERVQSLYIPAICVYIPLVVLEICFFEQRESFGLLHRFGIITGLILFANISISFIKTKYANLLDKVSDSTFFLYAYHSIMVMILTKLMFRFVMKQTWDSFVLIYFMRPIITVSVGIVLFKVLVKHVPRFSKIINGR